ncbi:hypothetical protein D3C72_476660 [compost metagenome]
MMLVGMPTVTLAVSDLKVRDAPDIAQERQAVGLRPHKRLFAGDFLERRGLLEMLKSILDLAEQVAQIVAQAMLDRERQHVGAALVLGDRLIGAGNLVTPGAVDLGAAHRARPHRTTHRNVVPAHRTALNVLMQLGRLLRQLGAEAGDDAEHGRTVDRLGRGLAARLQVGKLSAFDEMAFLLDHRLPDLVSENRNDLAGLDVAILHLGGEVGVWGIDRLLPILPELGTRQVLLGIALKQPALHQRFVAVPVFDPILPLFAVGVAKNLARFRVDYFLNLLIFKGFIARSTARFCGKDRSIT